MNDRFVPALALTITMLTLSACGGNEAQRTSASPAASPTISTQQLVQRVNDALTVTFVSAVVEKPATGNALAQVRVVYRLTANNDVGVQAAYGSADLPGHPQCDGGATIQVEYVGSIPPH